jgi:hypothetical protein
MALSPPRHLDGCYQEPLSRYFSSRENFAIFMGTLESYSISSALRLKRQNSPTAWFVLIVVKMFGHGESFIRLKGNFGQFLHFCWMSSHSQWKGPTGEILTFMQETGKLKFPGSVCVFKLRSISYPTGNENALRIYLYHVYWQLWKVPPYLRFKLR